MPERPSVLRVVGLALALIAIGVGLLVWHWCASF
jgi:hypothetical protein